jgi:phosphotransferase system enzyme I (PtsI)
MVVVKGLPVSGGIVIGKVMLVDGDDVRVPRRGVEAGQVAQEEQRLDKAFADAMDEVGKLHEKAQKEMGKEAAEIFRSHQTMLKDPWLAGQIKKTIRAELVTAEYASYATLTALANQFRAMKNASFSSKVNDIDDLSHRLHRFLVGQQKARITQAGPNTIVVAKDLTPSQTAGFDRSKIIGFVTDLGGMTSHTAIIAKALEIPAVVGVQTLLQRVTDGAAIIVDGDTGSVTLHPTPEAIADAKRAIEQRKLYRISVGEVANLPSITLDGTKVSVVGNIELPDEVEKVLKAGGEGVGLYRTEYLYLTSDHEPTEEEHFAAYKRCVKLSAGRELVIRTFDLGADKLTQAMEETPERNPFLGNRSIRYCLKNPAMFKRQLRAILRASALGPIKIMLPLVSSVGEIRQTKFILNDVMEELSEERVKFDASIKLGMMVEVPSVALLADTFAREVDFFSIGTNDLTQYTLAVDRINERVAHLYQPAHPAVIKLIRDVTRAARRRNTPISCCGEAAAEPEYAMLLLGLGLRTLSVSSSSIPSLKRFIRSVTIEQCERIARQALSLDSDAAITTLLRDRARKIVPEAFSGRSAE